jgi:hypothetical protein
MMHATGGPPYLAALAARPRETHADDRRTPARQPEAARAFAT